MTDLLLVAGTRPEAVKMAPVIEQLQKSNMGFRFVWSGQHYDVEMSKLFFEQLGLPRPDYDLDVRSGTHSEQTGRVMVKLEKIIRKCRPSIVVSEGDTNTVLAAALTSVKCLVPFAHVEAGLRSWNMAMPEEVNRKIADSVASLHFAPSKMAALNLLFEGVSNNGLHLTGNTIVDIVHRHTNTAKKIGERVLAELNLEREKYLLVTLHRAENTDNRPRLRSIMTGLRKLADEFRVVFPIHPRTRKRITQLGMGNQLKRVTQIRPVGYWEFLGLLMNSLVVLTDSGGVQEEACIVRVPTVTLRYNTERPETLLYGNVLAGAEAHAIASLVYRQVELGQKIRKSSMSNPFGDGHAGEKIVKALRNSLEKGLTIDEPDLRKSQSVMHKLLQTKQMARNRMLRCLSHSTHKDLFA